MAQDWYVGIGGKASRIVKAYIGVGGKAREIVAGYVGVGGKARKFWGGGRVKYKGVYSGIRLGYQNGGSNASYAIFMYFGAYSDGYDVDVYNKSLVRSNGPENSGRANFSDDCRLGTYAVFAGRREARLYNANLTISELNYSVSIRNGAGACSLGTSCAIGFGSASNDEYNSTVDFYSENLARTKGTGSDGRSSLGAASTTNHYIFAGGATGGGGTHGGHNTFNAFDKNRVHTAGKIGAIRFSLRSGTVNGTAVFGGGQSYMSYQTTVWAIKDNLTVSTLTPLSYANSGYWAANAGNYLIFMPTDNENVNVDIYDKNLVKTVESKQFTSQTISASASFDDLGIFVVRNESSATSAGSIAVYEV